MPDEELQKTQRHVTLRDANSVISHQCWWSYFFIRHLSTRLSVLVANRTHITPNQLTWAAFALGIAAAYFFYLGDHVYLIIGAVLFEINYLLDCMDGTVARLRGTGSAFGGILDHTLDRIRTFIALLALVYGQFRLQGDTLILFLGLAYLFANMFFLYTRRLIDENKLLVNKALMTFTMRSYLDKTADRHSPDKTPQRYPEPSDGRNRKGGGFYSFVTSLRRRLLVRVGRDNVYVYPTDIEAETLAFLIFPVLNSVSLGLLISTVGLLLTTLVFIVYEYSRIREKRLRIEGDLLADKIRRTSSDDLSEEIGRFEHSFGLIEYDEDRRLVRRRFAEFKAEQQFRALFESYIAGTVTKTEFPRFLNYLANEKGRRYSEIEFATLFGKTFAANLDLKVVEMFLRIARRGSKTRLRAD